LLLRRANRIEEAKAEFFKVLRLNPNHGKAAGNLGLIFMQQGNRTEAEAHLSHAVSVDPEDALARRYLNELARGQ
jgi:Flp pilus assembly protein TadD